MRESVKVKCGQLPNGVRFYSQHDNSSSRELALIVVMAGSFHDPPYRRGLAHVVEHVVCAKSQEHDDVDMLLERICKAGQNITTHWERTTYGFSDLVKKIHARELFHLFAGMIKNPIIEQELVDPDKAAIHQEHYLTGEDDVFTHAEEILRELIFPKPFLARVPIDGYMNEVKKITPHDIRRFVNRYYVPANVFVIYFGPRHNEVKTLVAKEFDEWKKRPQSKIVPFTLSEKAGGFSPLKTSLKREVERGGIHQCHAMVGFPTETYMSADAEALDVLASILSKKMFSELRSKNSDWEGGAYETPVETERTFGHGLFKFNFASLDRSFVDRGIACFHEQCDYLCKEIMSREDIEVAVGYMYDYTYRDLFRTDSTGLAEEVAIAVSNGDVSLEHFHTRGDRLLKLLKRGGRQKLREVAQKYFSGHSATVIINPQET